MKIDFVSDVACPWCAVGLNSLERALERLGGEIPVELHFQPFELNPDMPAEGADGVPAEGDDGVPAAGVPCTGLRTLLSSAQVWPPSLVS